MGSSFALEREWERLGRRFTRREFGLMATLLTAGAALPPQDRFASRDLSQPQCVENRPALPASAVRIDRQLKLRHRFQLDGVVFDFLG